MTEIRSEMRAFVTLIFGSATNNAAAVSKRNCKRSVTGVRLVIFCDSVENCERPSPQASAIESKVQGSSCRRVRLSKNKRSVRLLPESDASSCGLRDSNKSAATETASAVLTGDFINYGPQRALDGNAETPWASGPAGIASASFEIVLGAVRNFNSILSDEYEPSPGVGHVTSFRFQAWVNAA